jgi:hypothetical protein
LDVILLEHDFFEHFGEGVTAGVSRVALGFGDGDGLGIDKMPHARIAADHDELAEGGAGATGFEQPEQAFDGYIHDLLGRFFDGGKVQDVGNARDGVFGYFAVLDGAENRFEARVRVEGAVVAQGADAKVVEGRVSQQAGDERFAHFAGCAGDEEQGGS